MIDSETSSSFFVGLTRARWSRVQTIQIVVLRLNYTLPWVSFTTLNCPISRRELRFKFAEAATIDVPPAHANPVTPVRTFNAASGAFGASSSNSRYS